MAKSNRTRGQGDSDSRAAKPNPLWPAYTVERWPIERLTPYAKNARTHSDAQIEQLRTAIRAYGWTVPILAREDGTVIAGHGRLLAGQAEGAAEVPVIVARGWTEEQCRAYAIADNEIALNSDWDNAALAAELSDRIISPRVARPP
jgi:ParB-like chromosome segregation protein Spo0J